MEPAAPETDAKRYAPATERNREPIRAVLESVLPAAGSVLEVAAGTGQHGAFFATLWPGITWQPTDGDDEALASIAAWSAEAGLPNLRPARSLDVRRLPWPPFPDQPFDGVIAINLIHIAPWEACRGLMAGAARVLKTGGFLFLYGPFREGGRHTAPSNAEFDAMLRAQDPRFGVRDLDEVAAAAGASGFALESRVPMPANNLSLIFRATAAALADAAATPPKTPASH